jgi:hypothetical protein
LSSILDSLKKLEKETPHQDHLLPRARANRKVVISKRAISIITGVCICIGAIGLAGYYRGVPKKIPEPLTRETAPAPKPAATPAAIIDDPKKPLAPSNKTSVPLPSMSINHNSTATAVMPEIKTPAIESTTKPVLPESKSGERNVKTETGQDIEIIKPPKEEPVKDTATQEPEPDVLITTEDPSDSLDALSQKTSPPEDKPVPIDRLEGVSIKIQAISWSEIPAQSLAVINNQVVREGDGIEGYQISHINIDDIVLRRGDKAYRLEFRSKGLP